MGLFNKKKKEINKGATPSLPDLPRLPDFPRLEDEDSFPIKEEEKMSRLPSFPSNSLGSKFSQESIKEAVKGEREDYEDDANDFEFDEDEERRMMQKPLRKPLTREIGERKGRFDFDSEVEEPVFIRLDKFEEALRIFNETKRKVTDIERTLDDIKKVREIEEKEFQIWEDEMRDMKIQIERINQDIFSKI